MLHKVIFTTSLLLLAATGNAATLSYEPALSRGVNTANQNYTAISLGLQPSSGDRRVEISGASQGPINTAQNLEFANTISGNRPDVSSLDNTTQALLNDTEFFVNASINLSATCLGNPTAGTCPARIEASNNTRFDFSVDEASTLTFSGFYDGGSSTRHINDDQTIFSITNANRNFDFFYSASSNLNFSDFIFDQTSGVFSGQLI